MNLFHIWCISKWYFCAGLWADESMYELFKNRLSSLHGSTVLLDVNLTGFQSQMFWGLVSLTYLPRIGMPDVMHKSLCREKLLMKSLPIVSCCAGKFLARPYFFLFYPSWCDPLIPCCGKTVQLVFGSFSEEIFPYVAIDLLCLQEEVSSGSFDTTISNCLSLDNLRFI